MPFKFPTVSCTVMGEKSERESDSGWKKVARRNPFPNNWRHAPELPSLTKPFTPYQSSFAQVVQSSPPNDTLPPRLAPRKTQPVHCPPPKPIPATITPTSLPTSAPNHTPAPNSTSLKQHQPPPSLNPQTKNQYISHHTKPGLRFPPSPTYPEWRGKCFRCCKSGHTVANCRNLTKCGRC